MSIAKKLTTIAENEEKVYNAGYEKGKAEGVTVLKDDFWEEYQQSGTRTNYSHAFPGTFWTDKTFYPKYNMRPTEAYKMFAYSDIKNLTNKLSELNVLLDFSNLTMAQNIFESAKVTALGEINFSSATSLTSVFNYASNLTTIEKIKLKNGAVMDNLMFNCKNLEHVVFEGKTASNVRFSACTKLDKESIISIFGMLSENAEGKTLTLSKTAVNTAFGIDVSDEETFTEEWINLVETKSNWTVSLV